MKTVRLLLGAVPFFVLCVVVRPAGESAWLWLWYALRFMGVLVVLDLLTRLAKVIFLHGWNWFERLGGYPDHRY
jgi:hypothetical protein